MNNHSQKTLLLLTTVTHPSGPPELSEIPLQRIDYVTAEKHRNVFLSTIPEYGVQIESTEGTKKPHKASKQRGRPSKSKKRPHKHEVRSHKSPRQREELPPQFAAALWQGTAHFSQPECFLSSSKLIRTRVNKLNTPNIQSNFEALLLSSCLIAFKNPLWLPHSPLTSWYLPRALVLMLSQVMCPGLSLHRFLSFKSGETCLK